MDEHKIKTEVNRCFNCNNKPCVKACPLENDIPTIISLIQKNKFKEAYNLLTQTTVLPSICGRICPYEKQCKSNCTRKYKSEAIEIGLIECFLGDKAIEENWKLSNISNKLLGKNFAIIGCGPAGLTCAAFLKRNGANVTIYDKRSELGGLLRYGIPEFRLDKNILNAAIKQICDLGIQVVTNYDLEKNIDELKEKYDGIFLSIGANLPKKSSVVDDKLGWIFNCNEILENGISFDCRNKKIYICGAGNVAIDAARTLKRLGANSVTILYRRDAERMSAERKEIETAKKEKIKFEYNVNILKAFEECNVRKLRCVKTCELGLSVQNIENTEFEIDTDYLLMAIGSKTDSILLEKLKLETDKNGYVKIDENNQTSDEKIFAGGNLVGIKSTVAWAARSGRDAAYNIVKVYSS